jgi:hypothetical protein
MATKSAVRRGTSYAGKIDQQERGTNCGGSSPVSSKNEKYAGFGSSSPRELSLSCFAWCFLFPIPPDRALLREIKRGLLQFPRFAYAVVRRAPLRMLHVACALGRFRGGTESVYYS